jgi:hypothetical protein
MAMPIELDHFIVPSRDKAKAAKLLADLLGVRSAPAQLGPFHSVYVNDGLTLDFVDSDEAFPIHHYAFRVTEADFDLIFGRINKAGIQYRSMPHGPMDMKINTDHGGRIVYWTEPDGHYWEILTVSYARHSNK